MASRAKRIMPDIFRTMDGPPLVDGKFGSWLGVGYSNCMGIILNGEVTRKSIKIRPMPFIVGIFF